MEEDLIFSQIEDDLNFTLGWFSVYNLILSKWNLEADLIFFKWKATSISLWKQGDLNIFFKNATQNKLNIDKNETK